MGVFGGEASEANVATPSKRWRVTRVPRRLAPALARGRSAMTWHGMALGRDGMGWDDTRHRSLLTMPAASRVVAKE